MPKNFFAVVSDETAQASRSRDAGVADGSAVAVFVGSDGLARAARGVERERGLGVCVQLWLVWARSGPASAHALRLLL